MVGSLQTAPPNKRIKLARRSADVAIRYRRARSLSAVRWVDYRDADGPRRRSGWVQ